MQILSGEVCAALDKHIINIHHGFLPSFVGAKPYHQAYERGVKLLARGLRYHREDRVLVYANKTIVFR